MSIMYYHRDPAFTIEVLKVEESTTAAEFATIIGHSAKPGTLNIGRQERGFDVIYTDRMGSPAFRFIAYGSYLLIDEYGLRQETAARFARANLKPA